MHIELVPARHPADLGDGFVLPEGFRRLRERIRLGLHLEIARRRAGNPLEEMLGRSVRELFPDLDESWYDMARRAALLGETIVDTLYYKKTELRYYITGNQIIRPGYCSFTYQELDRDGKPVEPDAL